MVPVGCPSSGLENLRTLYCDTPLGGEPPLTKTLQRANQSPGAQFAPPQSQLLATPAYLASHERVPRARPKEQPHAGARRARGDQPDPVVAARSPLRDSV